MIVLKRIYEAPSEEDGYRILVDRLWPRGISKEEAKLDEWLKEVAPSPALRKWFGHKEEKWEEFRYHYKVELREKAFILNKLKALEKEHGKISLLYAARSLTHNHVLVLQEIMNTQN